MDSNQTQLSHIWTLVFPEIDVQSGSINRSYRPDDPTVKAGSTRSVELAQKNPGKTSEGIPKFLPSSNGTFELKEKIGEGGMGQIYRASQANLSRDVAIKVFQPGMNKAGDTEQFLAEARVTAWLDHPNIVPAHFLQEFPSGEIQLAMKLVGGESWAQHLDQSKPWTSETVPEDQLEILLQVCNAIAFAHSKGIAHLDLKPDNVMVGEFGEVLVLDWGLAIDFSEQSDADTIQRVPHKSDLTHPAGTPSYMAPEIALGKGSDIGPWTDCYLLGGILIKILTGTPPNRASSFIETLNNAVYGPMHELPQWVPDELKSIVTKSQVKETKDRYQSVNEFQNDLKAFLTHRQSLVLSNQAGEQLAQAAKTHRSEKVYQHYADALSGFEQALKLWSKNPAASAGREEAITSTLRHALSMGDLSLARSKLSRLSESHSEAKILAELVCKAEQQLEEEGRLQESQRKRLKVALFALFVGLFVGIVLISAAERDALDALAQSKKAQAETEQAREETVSALDKLKDANSKTTMALDESNQRLAEFYLMAGRFHSEAKQQLFAELFFSKSLVQNESAAARQGLVRTRLAQVDGWSQSYASPSQIPVAMVESNQHAVLVVFRKFEPKTFKITGFTVEVYEPASPQQTSSQFPWRHFQFDISKQYNFTRKPLFPASMDTLELSQWESRSPRA
ncbi:MAG: serine/threonine-protein kinase [Planctomycetota bacterium]|nr:serine/threonine-protein kinase [Planctomycetota bacterium]